MTTAMSGNRSDGEIESSDEGELLSDNEPEVAKPQNHQLGGYSMFQPVKQESRKRARADEINDGYPGHESRDRNQRETSSYRDIRGDFHSKPDNHARPDPTRRLSPRDNYPRDNNPRDNNPRDNNPRDNHPRDYHPRDNFQRERDAFSRGNYQYHDRDNYPPRDSVPVSRDHSGPGGNPVRDSNSRDSPFKRANREKGPNHLITV